MLAYALLYRSSKCTIHCWMSRASAWSQLVFPAWPSSQAAANQRTADGVALHRPGRFALGGQVQPERGDVRAERPRVQQPGRPGLPGASPRAGHSFPLLGLAGGRGMVRGAPFVRVTGHG